MASINKVIIVGNLGNEPENRYMPNGDQVTNISVATTDKWTDKNTGERKELTEWHRITFYRKLAEIAGQYLRKGSQVYVEGRLRTRKYTDKEGIERYATEIIADAMQMLGSAQNAGSSQGNYPASRQGQNSYANQKNGTIPPASARPLSDMDDDIPF